MAHTPVNNRILVGVDGTAASDAAVRWAVREARLRHATVHLVRACPSDARLRAPYAPWSAVPVRGERKTAARTELAATAELARRRLPPGRLIADLVDEPPVRALLDRTAGAEMLVLGTTRPDREPGEPPPAMGPVVRTCLRLADCPVVVIATGGQPTWPECLPSSDFLARHGALGP